VSVGEVNLLPPLIRRLQSERPGLRIVVSTSTDSGYDLAVSRFGSDRVFFCPLDFSWSVRRTLRNLNPDAIVLMELELWPNLIRLSTRRGCGVAVVNARLSERTAAGYQRFGAVTRGTFRRLAWVGCQDEATADKFRACGAKPDRLRVTGSIKFDNAPDSREVAEVQQRYNWAGIDPWHRVWCFGSTQPGEERLALAVYQRLRTDHADLRLILAPRHAERFDAVADDITRAGLRPARRSRNDSQYGDLWEGDEIILIDTIGELRHWWGVCHIATVGGSFSDRGGQNMLEPAGYGCAVSFGPDTRNFDEIAARLIEAGGSVRVADEAELESFVRRCLDDPPAADALGHAARAVIARHRGATEQTVRAIAEKFFNPAKNSRMPPRAA
jgi:3-deoxy-D-manno-octulosonic-acid transferase